MYYNCPQSPLLYSKMLQCGLLFKFLWLSLLYAMFNVLSNNIIVYLKQNVSFLIHVH